MERLGYYAKCKNTGNLFQFKWDDQDKFYIKLTSDGYHEKNPDEYEILEIGFFTADDY